MQPADQRNECCTGSEPRPVSVRSCCRRDVAGPEPFLDDPVGWVTSTTGEFMWSKQRQIAQSVHDNRFTAVKSCHGSGKSFTAARIAAWWLTTHAPGEAFVVTTAPTYKQLHAVLWREIGRAHRLADLPGRITLEDEWYIGQELVGFGRKPADYDPSAFQGIHAHYLLVIMTRPAACRRPSSTHAVDSLATNIHARVLSATPTTRPLTSPRSASPARAARSSASAPSTHRPARARRCPRTC
jgi:hypothetical protein